MWRCISGRSGQGLPRTHSFNHCYRGAQFLKLKPKCWTNWWAYIRSKFAKTIHFLTLFRGCWVRIFCGQTTAILAKIFRGISQPLQAKAGIVPLIRPWLLPSTSLAHHTLFILLLGTTQPEILKWSLKSDK
jgi:hypothetical protein